MAQIIGPPGVDLPFDVGFPNVGIYFPSPTKTFAGEPAKVYQITRDPANPKATTGPFWGFHVAIFNTGYPQGTVPTVGQLWPRGDLSQQG